MPKGTPRGQDELLSICDGQQNLNIAQAAALLNTSQAAVYQLTSARKLHPIRARGVLVFARGDLERYRGAELERELCAKFVEGQHPLDVYMEADGRIPLGGVERVLREWAKLTGIWLVEAPRGSYARWLERMKLRAVSPRSLRRLIEALLTDPLVDARARSYLLDQRAMNGQGENAKVRAEARQARRATLPARAETVDAEPAAT